MNQVSEQNTQTLCPCGSGKDFAACCGPILAGERAAATAEQLMRSRYSAYALGKIEYLATSLHPDYRADLDLVATRRWSDGAQWLSLQVLDTQAGGENDQEGIVDFIATYKEKGVLRPHREKAGFRRHDGIWYYTEGEMVQAETQSRGGAKVGRNEPCPCGSGKKYKKCCGR